MENGGAISLQTLVQSECEFTQYELTSQIDNSIMMIAF